MQSPKIYSLLEEPISSDTVEKTTPASVTSIVGMNVIAPNNGNASSMPKINLNDDQSPERTPLPAIAPPAKRVMVSRINPILANTLTATPSPSPPASFQPRSLKPTSSTSSLIIAKQSSPSDSTTTIKHDPLPLNAPTVMSNNHYTPAGDPIQEQSTHNQLQYSASLPSCSDSKLDSSDSTSDSTTKLITPNTKTYDSLDQRVIVNPAATCVQVKSSLIPHSPTNEESVETTPSLGAADSSASPLPVDSTSASSEDATTLSPFAKEEDGIKSEEATVTSTGVTTNSSSNGRRNQRSTTLPIPQSGVTGVSWYGGQGYNMYWVAQWHEEKRQRKQLFSTGRPTTEHPLGIKYNSALRNAIRRRREMVDNLNLRSRSRGTIPPLATIQAFEIPSRHVTFDPKDETEKLIAHVIEFLAEPPPGQAFETAIATPFVSLPMANTSEVIMLAGMYLSSPTSPTVERHIATLMSEGRLVSDSSPVKDELTMSGNDMGEMLEAIAAPSRIYFPRRIYEGTTAGSAAVMQQLQQHVHPMMASAASSLLSPQSRLNYSPQLKAILSALSVEDRVKLAHAAALSLYPHPHHAIPPDVATKQHTSHQTPTSCGFPGMGSFGSSPMVSTFVNPSASLSPFSQSHHYVDPSHWISFHQHQLQLIEAAHGLEAAIAAGRVPSKIPTPNPNHFRHSASNPTVPSTKLEGTNVHSSNLSSSTTVQLPPCVATATAAQVDLQRQMIQHQLQQQAIGGSLFNNSHTPTAVQQATFDATSQSRRQEGTTTKSDCDISVRRNLSSSPTVSPSSSTAQAATSTIINSDPCSASESTTVVVTRPQPSQDTTSTESSGDGSSSSRI